MIFSWLCCLFLLSVDAYSQVSSRLTDDSSLKHLLERIDRQDDVIAQLTDTVQRQSHELTSLRNAARNQRAGLDHVSKNMRVRSSHSAVFSPSTYASSATGCLYDTLELSCTPPTQINVTIGYYGLYATSCSGCCPPDLDADCTEQMEESRPSDWFAIKYTCDNQTTCSFDYLGHALANCTPPEIADYLYVEYDCWEEVAAPPEEVIAFTAYATNSENYIGGETVQFPEVLTNLGGLYSASGSVFTCGPAGVYMFSMSLNSVNSNYMEAAIVLDGDQLVGARADNDNSARNEASNIAITECQQGQEVYVMAGGLVENFSSNEVTSSFSGVLLFRYD